jgi:hypothetical protein
MTPSRIALALLTAGILAGMAPAAALHAQAPTQVVLSGRAQAGADARDVRFVFLCTANDGANVTGALSVELAVPGYEALSAAFSFDDFEGPDADAGKLTRLEATAAGGKAQESFAVGGWIGVEADQPFYLGLSGALRNDAPRLAAIAKILRRLTAGPGQLVWRQGNAQKNGVPLVATLTVTAADATRLQALLGPCLAAAGRGG